MTNLVPNRSRELAVANVDGPLTSERLRKHFMGKEAYRRTEYIAALADGSAALLRVKKKSKDPLFSPISEIEFLAGPSDCALVSAPDVDTSVPTQLARIAAQEAPHARCVIVSGRYGHVSFILDPTPVRIRVFDVVPPEPAKLVDQARRILEVASDLPPIELIPDVIDIGSLASQRPSDSYLLPCYVSGIDIDGSRVSYLDQRPAHEPWVLIGCDRSQQIHRWFYGESAPAVDICPRHRPAGGSDLVLTKCCLIENHVEVQGRQVCVPWGATLELVREGLVAAVAVMEPTWEPV